MELDDLPITGLEPLEPLLAWLIIYLLGLVVLRLLLWPLLANLLFRRGPRAARTASALLVRLVALGAVGLAALWALAALGLDEWFYDLLEEIPDLDLATIGPVALFFLFLFALVYFFVIRPALKWLRSVR